VLGESNSEDLGRSAKTLAPLRPNSPLAAPARINAEMIFQAEYSIGFVPGIDILRPIDAGR
jgi:hypothetical protein